MLMSQIKGWATRLPVWVLAGVIIGGTVAAEPGKTDVRVLIDISGSMRQNDPQNLRRPALRMLSGLLQPGTRAGVWTFARWVNNLVPVAEVDSDWKKRTQSLSQQIASPGQFTNIEEVLDRASRDWHDAPATHARHLVLLTDGMVDVSKTPGESEASRARIIDTLLPRLVEDGVKVHTIALSARADHDLMQEISGMTGGWYQQVDKAADLQRVFLRMFEKVGQPDTVPLEGNRFVIDGAVDEATVLAFRAADSPATRLSSPSGEAFTDSDLTAGVAWFRDEGYDLITLDSPEKGEWVLEADLDPDNRVMIVTDLKLQTSEVPTHIAVGEQTRIEASLSNRGKVVTRQAFLRLLDVHAVASGIDGLGKLTMNDAGEVDDVEAGDGRYTLRFGADQPAQDVELLVTVESPTFMREKRYRMVVHDPIDALVETGPDGPVLAIALEKAVMQPGATVTAWQELVPGEGTPLELVETEGGWRAPLLVTVSPSYVQLSGTTRSGTLVDRQFGPYMPEGIEPPEVVEPPPAEEEEAPAVAEPASEPIVEAAPPMPEDEASGWVLPAVIFGVFNLLLIAGGLVWFFIRRRSTKAVDTALDDLIEATQSQTGADGVQENAA